MADLPDRLIPNPQLLCQAGRLHSVGFIYLFIFFYCSTVTLFRMSTFCRIKWKLGISNALNTAECKRSNGIERIRSVIALCRCLDDYQPFLYNLSKTMTGCLSILTHFFFSFSRLLAISIFEIEKKYSKLVRTIITIDRGESDKKSITP